MRESGKGREDWEKGWLSFFLGGERERGRANGGLLGLVLCLVEARMGGRKRDLFPFLVRNGDALDLRQQKVRLHTKRGVRERSEPDAQEIRTNTWLASLKNLARG